MKRITPQREVPEAKFPLVMAEIARANVRAAGMEAENRQRAMHDSSPAYAGDEFETVITEMEEAIKEILEP